METVHTKDHSHGNQTKQWKQSPCLGGLPVNTNNRFNSLGGPSARQNVGCCCPTAGSVCLSLWLLQFWVLAAVLAVFAVCPIHIPMTTECPQMRMTNLTWAMTNLICIWTSYLRGKKGNHRSKGHQSLVAWVVNWEVLWRKLSIIFLSFESCPPKWSAALCFLPASLPILTSNGWAVLMLLARAGLWCSGHPTPLSHSMLLTDTEAPPALAHKKFLHKESELKFQTGFYLG